MNKGIMVPAWRLTDEGWKREGWMFAVVGSRVMVEPGVFGVATPYGVQLELGGPYAKV